VVDAIAGELLGVCKCTYTIGVDDLPVVHPIAGKLLGPCTVIDHIMGNLFWRGSATIVGSDMCK
jgi:hypothetical protein